MVVNVSKVYVAWCIDCEMELTTGNEDVCLEWAKKHVAKHPKDNVVVGRIVEDV